MKHGALERPLTIDIRLHRVMQYAGRADQKINVKRIVLAGFNRPSPGSVGHQDPLPNPDRSAAGRGERQCAGSFPRDLDGAHHVPGIGSDIVVDLSSHVGGDVGSPATRNYMRHKAITAGLDYTFYVRPRSVSVLEERRATIKLAPIILTATKERSCAETNRTLDIHFDEGVDRPGLLPISFVIWEEKAEGEASDTRIIVFTDADVLSNVYIYQYSNAEMGLNLVNWLSELDYQVFLGQKELKVERLDLTSKQRRSITAILFLMLPFIAAGGILVWMRR